MKNSYLASTLILALVSVVGFTQDHAPYHVIETGDKITFGQLEKKHLGLVCSVYFKPGNPNGHVGFTQGPPPEGMETHEEKGYIVTGELHDIGGTYIAIYGFYDQERENGGVRVHPIEAGAIDYIMFKKGEGFPESKKALDWKKDEMIAASAQDHAPYKVIESGEKLAFDQVEKKHFGLTCSVYCKPNKPQGEAVTGRLYPEGMATQKDVIVWIVTGEIDALGKNYIVLVGFYNKKRNRDTAMSACPIKSEDIDFIVFERKGP